MTLYLMTAIFLGGVGMSWSAECIEDSLSKNIDSGKHLLTNSGDLYDVLLGDNFDAMLWLPTSSLTICGPRHLAYKGKTFQLYKIINTDDGESVDAFREGKRSSPGSGVSSCYSSYITQPTPFLGNGGELIKLGDGSIWKESSYQYLYLYEYTPQVTICPDKGILIVGSNKFNVTRIK